MWEPGRPRGELVGKGLPWLDRVLRDVGHAVHVVRQTLAVEVHSRRLSHLVREDRPDPVALGDGQPWAGPRPVVAETGHWVLHGVDPMIDFLDRQLEHLDPVDDARLQGGISRAVHGRALAIQEPPDDGQRVGVMVHGRRRRGGRRDRAVVHRRSGGRWRRRGRGRLARGRCGRARRWIGPARRRRDGGARRDARRDDAAARGPQDRSTAHRTVVRW